MYCKQDEWVVCRVFQKSAGVKKYPTTQSTRAINLEMGPSHILTSPMMPLDPAQFNLGRNYMMNNHHVDQLAELSRALRSGGSTTTFPIQSQINYPTLGGGGGGGGSGPGGGFTISGLNLNLGGGSQGPAPPLRPMIHQQGAQHDVTSSMMTGLENSYASVDMNINGHGGSSGRFMNVDNCVEFDHYWPTY